MMRHFAQRFKPDKFAKLKSDPVMAWDEYEEFLAKSRALDESKGA
ncbi:MAG: hypothetical protein ACYDDF_09945 [Thermoplasmatota archaeon]